MFLLWARRHKQTQSSTRQKITVWFPNLTLNFSDDHHLLPDEDLPIVGWNRILCSLLYCWAKTASFLDNHEVETWRKRKRKKVENLRSVQWSQRLSANWPCLTVLRHEQPWGADGLWRRRRRSSPISRPPASEAPTPVARNPSEVFAWSGWYTNGYQEGAFVYSQLLALNVTIRCQIDSQDHSMQFRVLFWAGSSLENLR